MSNVFAFVFLTKKNNMSFICFENMAEGRIGDKIYLNSDHIMAIYTDNVENMSCTRIFTSNGSTYHIAESQELAVKLLNGLT